MNALLLRGLWRDNEEDLSRVVYDYVDALRKIQETYETFDIVERDEEGNVKKDERGNLIAKYSNDELVRHISVGAGGDRHAWTFTLWLPLLKEREISYTK